MSILERLQGQVGKSVLDIREVNTKFGSGYRALVAIGNGTKECNLIQDKATGEWKTFGDPAACTLIRKNLMEIGTPVEGQSTSEIIKEQPSE